MMCSPRSPRFPMGEHIMFWEAAKSLLLILSALFPIVDPLGGSPIFLSMTRQYSPSTRRAFEMSAARSLLKNSTRRG